MPSSILIMTFEDVRLADKALTVLDSLKSEKLFKLSDAVVVTKDVEGDLEIRETKEFTAEKGAISGGIAGLVVGTLLGGPIGGLLLGAAGGAIAGRVVDLGIPDEKVRQVGEALEVATSALLLELKSGDPKRLIAALEESGGQLFELTLSDEVKGQLEEQLATENPDPEPDED